VIQKGGEDWVKAEKSKGTDNQEDLVEMGKGKKGRNEQVEEDLDEGGSAHTRAGKNLHEACDKDVQGEGGRRGKEDRKEGGEG
jgi:hypothetical protein